jgi:predicted molibdopterin-dependent oxidoreductase YjgC
LYPVRPLYRGCGEIRNNFVLGRRGKVQRRHRVRFEPPMGNSACVSCGECVVSVPLAR